MMALSPGSAAHADDDTRDDGASMSIPSPPSSASAHTTSSPSAFLSLSDQTFTPLSMDSSSNSSSPDLDLTDDVDGLVVSGGDAAEPKKAGNVCCMPVLQDGVATGDQHWRFAPNPSTDAARNRSIVSSTVQSPRPLGATDTPPEEYDLLPSTKTIANSHFVHPTPNSPIQNQSGPSLAATTSPCSNADAGYAVAAAAAAAAAVTKAETLGAETRDKPAAHPHQPLLLQALHATAGTPQLSSRPPIVHVSKLNSPRRLLHSADSGHDINKDINTLISETEPVIVSPTAITTAAIATTIVRPKPKPLPQNAQPQPQPPTLPTHTADTATEPTAVRRVSSASVAIQHPVPDLSARSGACLGNIAALEATAERLSMTSSIEDAIRDAHEELKRSDSQRSSILRASRASQAESDANSTSGLPQLPVLSRQSSILSTNNAARLGGYSPAGYVMSPNPSLSNASTRLRSGSKASSLGVPPPAAGMIDPPLLSIDFGSGEDFSFMSRHGPGKSSVRSVASNKPSLAEIAEMEPPMTLTQDALDEADRVVAAGEDVDDEEDTIRANSQQQHIDMGPEMETVDMGADEMAQPMLKHDYIDLPSPNRLQLHRPDSYMHYGNYTNDRPDTSASNTTIEQAQTAFGDFDGVHCDPGVLDFPEPLPREPPSQRASEMPFQMPRAPPRPTSYVDAETGQHMLFYPARVPAMLNLPPKLSKNARPAARRKMRSQILSTMPTESRESRIWLPDPLEGLGEMGAPLMSENGTDDHGAADGAAEPLPQVDISPPAFDPEPVQSAAGHARHPSETVTVVPLDYQERDIQRQSRLTVGDNRKSRMSNTGDVAPQLRASVFFDLPPESPRIEVKDGSATATLDSILDASAGAPVSAFIDHSFAGKLGAEVYGREKKPKKKARNTMIADNRNSALAPLTVAEPKKRASILSLMAGARHNDETLDDDRRATTLGAAGEGGIRRVSSDGASVRHDQPITSPNQPASHEDGNSDEEDDDEDEDEEEDQYEGPPTTLLAELQLRKQQQKLRTRPVHKVFPNGLHSTLLDLDTVAEVQRKARKGKKINLAWEDPTAAQVEAMEDDYDEDVPLGVLYAAKAVANGGNISNMDISAVMGEIHRPLGLMERRDLEENEPLSRRRDRLQGRDLASATNLGIIQQRMSMMTLTPGGLGARSQSRLQLPMQMEESRSMAGDVAAGEDVDPEVEGETLAERKRRLNAETLPRARPVSGAFSSELLSQFGDLDEEETGGDPKTKEVKGKGKALAEAPGQSHDTAQLGGAEVPEEEETLGQRRRRIQAEREAREREMGGAIGNPPGRTGTPLSLNPNMNGSHNRLPSFSGDPTIEANRLSRPLSMAGILGAHPVEGPRGIADPREQERLRLESVAARAQWERDAKMAAVRAQMTQSLSSPTVGAPNGGYMGGRFNDGLGGGARVGQGLGYGAGAAMPQPKMPIYSGTPGYGGAGVNAPASVYGVGMNGATYGAGATMGSVYGMNNPYNGAGGMPMQMQMQMPPTQGHLDRVERWRQGVMP